MIPATPEGPWQEPVIGGFPTQAEWESLSGRELLDSWMEDRLPLPPLAYLFDLSFERNGDVSASIPASPWFTNLVGVIPAGILAVVADAALGWAFGARQAAGSFYTTVEMKLDVLGPSTPSGGRIRATGHAVHAARTLALTSCDVLTAGAFAAHGTSLLAVRPSADRAGIASADGSSRDRPPPGWIPAPRRELHTEQLGPEELGAMNGREMVEGCIENRLPTPPLGQLTGLRYVAVEHGSATAALPASQWFRPPTPFLQGGILALLADFALTGAAQSLLPPGEVAAVVDVKVNFLRPVLPDGGDVVASARVVQRGRSMAVAEAEIQDPAGRTAGVALATLSLLPLAALRAV